MNDLEAKGLTTARRDMVAEVKPLFKFLWPEPENENSYDGPPGDEKILISWDLNMEIFLCPTRRRSPAQRRKVLGTTFFLECHKVIDPKGGNYKAHKSRCMKPTTIRCPFCGLPLCEKNTRGSAATKAVRISVREQTSRQLRLAQI